MLNRLLSMIYILMNRGTVTARELAERFEVSTRTIYRDVETLSMAGIPVFAQKGKNGGISLTEQFVLNKMLVTKEEQTQILTALASLQETGAGQEQETLMKLGDFFHTEPINWVAIDFSDWSDYRRELYEQLKDAILKHSVIVFDYYGQDGQMSRRTVEPMQLFFKEYAWYLKAFCRTRHAMRLFKILRMKRVQVLKETFQRDEGKLEADIPVNLPQKIAKDKELIEVELLIEQKEAYRVYDRFPEEEITILPDGNFLIHTYCLPDNWSFGMLLSFGPSLKVLRPPKMQEEMQKRIELMKKNYE